MSFKKQYLKSKPVCKVTFRLPKETAAGAHKVSVTGEFNEWQIGKTPMKALKSGDFTATVELRPGREYQYRFVIDDNQWLTDTSADKVVHSGVGESRNSVIVV